MTIAVNSDKRTAVVRGCSLPMVILLSRQVDVDRSRGEDEAVARGYYVDDVRGIHRQTNRGDDLEGID